MPKYILTYRRPAGEPIDPEAGAEWMQWFEDLGEHLVEFRGPVAPGRELGDCSGAKRVGGFTVITADDEEQAIQLANGNPGLRRGHGVELAELVEVPAAA